MGQIEVGKNASRRSGLIFIQKKSEPEGLRLLREEAARRGLSPEQAYNTLRNPLKKDVLDALVKEQGRLCAYCMCRIPRSDVPGFSQIKPITIEHVIPRNPDDNRDVGQGLDYNNLVAVCHGNRAPRSAGHTVIDLTCDAHRENTELKKVDPCNASTLDSIEYEIDGTIKSSTDADVNDDLDQTLNLNYSQLKTERKAALDALIEDMKPCLDDVKQISLYVQTKLASFNNEPDPKTPYVGILIWYLKGFQNTTSLNEDDAANATVDQGSGT